MEQVEKKQTLIQSKASCIFTGFCGLVLLVAVLYGIRVWNGTRNDPGHTIGIVSEIFLPSLNSDFKYVYFVDGVKYIGMSSFYSADIEPGDTVYVNYEKGNPDNAILERRKLDWGNGDPLYSKRMISDTSKNAIGVIYEFYSPGAVTYFRYIYAVNGIKYTGASSFHRKISDIELEDIVYVSYEEGFPDTPVLIKGDNGDPVYSKRRTVLP